MHAIKRSSAFICGLNAVAPETLTSRKIAC